MSETTELQALNLEECARQAEELAFSDSNDIRKFRWLEKIVNDYSHLLEKKDDEMYNSRFFAPYQKQMKNLARLNEIVALKKEQLKNRVAIEAKQSGFDFIGYLNDIEASDTNQKRIIGIFKGAGQLKWQERFEAVWDEIGKIKDTRFLHQLKEGIKCCVSEGYLAERFKNSYLQNIAENLVYEIERRLKLNNC